MPVANSIGDQPLVVVLVIALFALAFVLGAFFNRYPPRCYVAYPRRFDARDVGAQMNAVISASFQKRRLMNNSEFQFFHAIEQDVIVRRAGYRIFAQTCLGEILASTDSNAYRSINSKRIDMLIVDRSGWPLLAIEYQGDGHYLGNAAARDAVKKEALRKAGVPYLEIFPKDGTEKILTLIHQQLGLNVPPGDVRELQDKLRSGAN